MGPDHAFTTLVPNLKGVDPDDAFGPVPYEKGHTFLYYLEELVGGPGRQILRRMLGVTVVVLQKSSNRVSEHGSRNTSI